MSDYSDSQILETEDQVVEEFNRLDNEYPTKLKFEDIEIKLHRTEDIHVFILLDRLVPNPDKEDMVRAADHDIIFLRPNPSDLVGCNRKIIEELHACGVYVWENEYLAMNV